MTHFATPHLGPENLPRHTPHPYKGVVVCGERSDVRQYVPLEWARADSEGSAPGFNAMAFRTGVVAVVGSGISAAAESCSRVAIVTGSLTRANRNRPGNGAC
jgi:hypothetical protein